jgi:hypothetical protein
MSDMTPREAADVLVRYCDPATGLVDGRDQPLDFPRQAFWVVIDHARATSSEGGPESRHEVECPSCGATIRARMADEPTNHQPHEGEGAFDGALAWVRRAAWDTPTSEQRADEDTIPDEHIDAVSRVLMRKYRAIAARLVIERHAALAPSVAAPPHRVLVYGEAGASEWQDCDGEGCATCAPGTVRDPERAT